MPKAIKILFFAALSMTVAAFYGNILNTPLAEPLKTASGPDYKWSTSSYVGYAWSDQCNLTTSDPNLFEQPATGETNNGPLGNVPFAGFVLRRHLYKFLELGFSYDIYGAFGYREYHINGIAPATRAGVEVLTSNNYARSFLLDHQSALANLYILLPKSWEISVRKLHIFPILSGAAGIGISKVKSFQTFSYSATAPYSQITTLGGTNTTKKLAWLVNIGINFQPQRSAVSFGVAYRYYNGGKFESSSAFVLNDSYNQGTVVELSSWVGTLKTQQFKIYINAEF